MSLCTRMGNRSITESEKRSTKVRSSIKSCRKLTTRLLAISAAAASLFTLPSARAATLTWDANAAAAGQTDGGGTWLATDQWWDGATNTTWVSGSDAVFGNGGAGGAVVLASPTTVNSFAFNTFTGTYTVGNAAQAITLNAGITIDSTAAAVTIVSPITLGGTQSWTNGSASTFTVSGAVTGGANVLTIDGSGNGLTTLTGGLNFSGAGGLVINKSGTLGTTISGGTITLGGTGGITIGIGASPVTLGAATISAAQSWANNSSSALITSGILALNSQLSLTAGAITLGNFSNTGTGGVVINGATVTASNSVAFGAAGGTLTLTSGKLQSNNGTLKTYSNLIAINGSFTIGDATLNGAQTFAGAATVTGSNTIDLAGGAVSFTTGTMSLQSGTNTTFSSSTAALTMSGGFNTNGGTDTLTLDTAANAVTLAGAFTGTAGTLVLAGSGTNVTLGALTGTANAIQINTSTGGIYTTSGASTFTGGVTLTSGKLNINAVGAAGASGPLGNGGAFNINGGTIDNTSGAAKVVLNVNPVTIGGDFSFSTSAGTATTNLTLPGTVSVAADQTVTMNGAGFLTFGGALTNAGNSTRTLTVNNGSGTTATSVFSVGGYALTSFATARTNVINGDGAVKITGAITNGLGAGSGLTYSGTGSLTLSGTNTYTGTLTMNGNSQLNINSIAAISPTSAGVVLKDGTVLDNTSGAAIVMTNGTSVGLFTASTGATVLTNTNANTSGLFVGQLINSASTSFGYITAIVPNTSITVSSGTGNTQTAASQILYSFVPETWNGNISFGGTAALTLATGGIALNTPATNLSNTGANTLTLGGPITGASNFTTAANANGGIAYYGLLNNTGTFTNNGSGNGTVIITNLGTNLTSVTQNSTTSILQLGSSTFNPANAYANGISVLAGTLQVANPGALGTGTVSLGGGSADTQLRIINIVGVTGNVSVLAGAGAASLRLNSSNNNASTFAGNISLANDFAIIGNGVASNGTANFTGNMTGTGNLSLNNIGTQAMNVTTGTLNFIGNISNVGTSTTTTTLSSTIGSSVGSISQNSGTSPLTLSGPSTSAGGVNLNVGTLTLGSATALGTGTFAIGADTTLNSSVANLVESNNNNVSLAGNLTFLGTQSLNLGSGSYTLLASSMITVNANTLTFGGTILGTKTITKDGNGALVISGNNATSTFTPVLTAGTLQYNAVNSFSGGSLPSGNSVLVNSASVLAAGYAIDQSFINIVNSSSTGVVALGVSSSNALDFSSGGANLANVSLGASATATYSGTLTPNGSTYRLGGGNGVLTFASVLSGSRSLVVGGPVASSVILNQTNTFTGPITVTNGTLNVNADAALGSASNSLSFGSATTFTAAGIIGSGHAIVLGGGTTITGTNSITSDISGTGPLTIGGTTLLAGKNTYTGGTVLGNGVKLFISSDANIGGASTALTLAASGNTLSILGNSFTSFGSRPVTFSGGNSNVLIMDIQSATNTFTLDQVDAVAPNSATTPGALQKYGAGILDVTVAQTYRNQSATGSSTAVYGGVLRINSPAGGSLSATQNNLSFSGGALYVLGKSNAAFSQTMQNVVANGNPGVLAGGGSIILDNNNSVGATATTLALGTIVAPTVAGSTLNIATLNLGSGSAVLTTTTTNDATGILGNGHITYSPAGGTTGFAAIVIGSTIGAYTGATAFVTSGSGSTTNYSLTGSASSVATESVNTLKIASSGAGQSLAQTGGTIFTVTTGGLLFTGANDYSITGGTLKSNTATNSDLLIHQYGAGNLTIGSVIANGVGASTLTKAGAGKLILTNTNTYTGATYVNGGVLSIDAVGELGATVSSAIFLNGGSLQSGGTYQVGATLQATDNITTTHTVSLGGSGGTFDVATGKTLTLNGVISGAGLTIKNSDLGSGTVVLGAANTFTGGLWINAGILQLNNATAIPANGYDTLTFGTATTEKLQLNNRNAIFAGLVSASANAVIENGGSTTDSAFTVYNGADQTFAGVFQDGGGTKNLSFAKGGGATLILTNTNTYTGTTAVTGGKLTIDTGGTINSTSGVSIGGGNFNYNSSTALTQAVTFANSGGTLSGSGTISGLVTTGGITSVLAPGNSTKWQSYTAGLDATVGTRLTMELSGDNTTTDASDRLVITGGLTGPTGTGGLVIDLLAYGFGPAIPNPGVVYTLVTFDGSSGLDTGDLAQGTITGGLVLDTTYGTANGFHLDTSGGGGSGSISVRFTSVPEPTSIGFLGLGAMGLLQRRRRRCRTV